MRSRSRSRKCLVYPAPSRHFPLMASSPGLWQMVVVQNIPFSSHDRSDFLSPILSHLLVFVQLLYFCFVEVLGGHRFSVYRGSPSPVSVVAGYRMKAGCDHPDQHRKTAVNYTVEAWGLTL